MRTAIPHIELGTYKCELITNNLFTNVVYICFSVSLESSVMGHDEMLQVLKEKTRLEGQLESLSSEANQVNITSISVLIFSVPSAQITHPYIIM